MAGTLLRAGADILRRSTTAGLGGLAIALLVGVLSFAFTTRPVGQEQESVARYLTMPARVVNLGTLGAAELTERTGKFIGPNAEVTPIAELVPADRRVSTSETTRAIAVPSGESPRALDAEEPRTPGEVSDPEPAPPPAEAAASVASAVPEAPAAPTAPVLAPGDQVTATVSFYYCEAGEQGLHRGDGGNFCGAMRDGTVVYSGAAACAYAYLGQEFRIVGDPTERVYRCADTGSAVHGLHRDIWFMSSDEGWEWQREVGQVATIEILP